MVSKNKSQKVKYITEIKKTPPSRDGVQREIDMERRTDANSGNVPKEVSKLALSEKLSKSSPQAKKSPVSIKDVILGIINLISAILLVIILVKFPKRAKELKDLKVEIIKNESSASFELEEVEASYLKMKELEKLFLDETGVVGFVKELEKLRAEKGVIEKITFTSKEIAKDKTGNFGSPIVIEMSGDWSSIDQTLQKIDDLTFLFRPVNIIIKKDEEEGKLIFRYGGFLYVSDRLGKN